MSKIEGLEKRIAELEAEVARLKAYRQPEYVTRDHYYYGHPAWVPQPAWAPLYPLTTYGGVVGFAG